MNKKGFTLVELSIALVIVGLLIGGILVGQSLIESAKINRFVSDLIQYEAAVVQFRNKFKKYPSDSPYFTPPGNGDNRNSYGANGGDDCAAAPNAALSNDETYQFWAHLSQAGMLSKKYAAFSPAAVSSGPACTGGVHHNNYEEIENAGIVYPYTELSPAAAQYHTTNKYPIYTSKDSIKGNFYFYFLTKPLDALAIENKLGSKAYNVINPDPQIGLHNGHGGGVGHCSGGSLSLCTDANAISGEFYYYLAPS